MSIYSGFATRFQQQSYDHCIDSLLYVLQKRIIKFYQNQAADEEKFITLLLKLHHQMKNMEKSKYLEPKSSQSVNELIKFVQNYPENISITHHIEKEKEQLPEIQHQPKIQDVPNQKKKSTHWVQKQQQTVQIPPNPASKTLSEPEVGTLSKNIKQVKGNEQKLQFKRTTYQPANIRAINIKGTSRSNLSKSRQDKYGLDDKQRSSKATSNYILQKPPIQSKVTYHATNTQTEVNFNVHKRKNKSTSRVNNQTDVPSGNHNEVADIIKDYIIKAKRSGSRGTNFNKDSKELSSKLQEF